LACPSGGVGLPEDSASLPLTGIAYDPTLLQSEGVAPYNMCILKGFNTTLAKTTTNVFPFGIWFANATTMYVADEGNGSNTYSDGMYTAAAGQPTAGLQKWVFNAGANEWKPAYTLQAGLNLGMPYNITGYPTGNIWRPDFGGLQQPTGFAT
jgi:hypothetical protein